jgi:sulfatase modifying factor 1
MALVRADDPINAYSLWAHGHDWRAYRGGQAIPKALVHLSAQGSAPPLNRLGSCLASEAEWEYAARGTDGRIWPWGSSPPTDELVCLARHGRGDPYVGAADIPASAVHELLGVGPFGHHHMSGNVWNWCRDYYDPTWYGCPDSRGANPQQGTPTPWRSERGGSWLSPVELGTTSYRRGRQPQVRGRCLGFRCSWAI